MSEEKRYIDIEKLIPEMKQESLKMFNSYYKGFVEAIKMIADFPVEDVAPVVHGHWSFGLSILSGKCSVCGCRYEDVDKFDYCPSCGAKMDEGRKA